MSKNNLEDLLEIIGESTSSDKKERTYPKFYPTQLKRFFNEMGIEEGQFEYPNYLIFYIYKQIWDGVDRTNKYTKMKFFTNFGRIFNGHRKSTQRFYKLNSFIHITDDLLNEAKRYDEIYQKQQKTKYKTSKSKKKIQPKG